jgi:hypothetical protein
MELLVLLFIMSLLLAPFTSAAVGALIGISRGRDGRRAAILSFFLGPIGWLMAALTQPRFHCPRCREPIRELATKCPHCHGPIQWNQGHTYPWPSPV